MQLRIKLQPIKLQMHKKLRACIQIHLRIRIYLYYMQKFEFCLQWLSIKNQWEWYDNSGFLAICKDS